MAGTSTGGIISLALSRDAGGGVPKYKAQDLLDMYVNRGTKIFSRSFWQGVSSVGGFTEEKYCQCPLEEILRPLWTRPMTIWMMPPLPTWRP
jgi:patatin-like phospholipase/acyl hydrolase